MKTPLVYILLIVSVFMLAGSCIVRAQTFADTMRIRQVDIVAQSPWEKIQIAGGNVTLIDSTSLALARGQNLGELLTTRSSVFVKSYGRGALATVSFRGTAPSHTQLIWNGMPVNSPLLGMTDFSTIPVFFADNIAILHGPASMTETAGALGGAVVLNTRPQWKRGFSSSLTTAIASFGSYDQFVTAGGGNSRWQTSTKLFFRESANDYTYKNITSPDLDPLTGTYHYPTDTNKNADYSQYGLLQEIHYRPRADRFISCMVWAQRLDRGIPALDSYEGFEEGNINRQQAENFRAAVNYERHEEKWMLKLSSGIQHNVTDYTVTSAVHGTTSILSLSSQTVENSAHAKVSIERQADSRHRPSFRLQGGHTAVISGDRAHNLYMEKQQTEFHATATLESRWNPRLTTIVLAGESSSGNRFSLPLARASASFLIDKRSCLRIGTQLAHNYRFPSLLDRYAIPGGNPDLNAESGYSAEGMIAIGNFEGIAAEITCFAAHVNNWIIWLPGFKGYWEPHNIERVKTGGIETSVSYTGGYGSWEHKLSVNYAFNRSRNFGTPLHWGDNAHGRQMVYIPLHSANANAGVSYRNWQINYNWYFYSERFTTASNQKNSLRDWLYPVFMNTLSLSKEFDVSPCKFYVQFRLENLFNETYQSVLQRVMPGRNYSLLFRVAF